MKAVISKRLHVFVPFCLLINDLSKSSIPPTITGKGDPDKVYTGMAITSLSIEEDVLMQSEPRTVIWL